MLKFTMTEKKFESVEQSISYLNDDYELFAISQNERGFIFEFNGKLYFYKTFKSFKENINRLIKKYHLDEHRNDIVTY